MILDMLFSPSSEFYSELYNEGLIDSNFGAYFTGKKTYGHSLIVGQSNSPKEIYKRIEDFFSKDPSGVLNNSDFDYNNFLNNVNTFLPYFGR